MRERQQRDINEKRRDAAMIESRMFSSILDVMFRRKPKRNIISHFTARNFSSFVSLKNSKQARGFCILIRSFARGNRFCIFLHSANRPSFRDSVEQRIIHASPNWEIQVQDEVHDCLYMLMKGRCSVSSRLTSVHQTPWTGAQHPAEVNRVKRKRISAERFESSRLEVRHVSALCFSSLSPLSISPIFQKSRYVIALARKTFYRIYARKIYKHSALTLTIKLTTRGSMR